MIILQAEPCSTALRKKNLDSEHINLGDHSVTVPPSWGLLPFPYAISRRHGVSGIN